ncbi:MAG: transporter [Candidatus Obscuribacterales bacterium]|nr:transporter [Candidatus Obscuribacterales bacterium]
MTSKRQKNTRAILFCLLLASLFLIAPDASAQDQLSGSNNQGKTDSEPEEPESKQSKQNEPDKDKNASPYPVTDLTPITLLKKGVKSFIHAQDFEPMISTDRNSVTPHPNAVPKGYIQIESGSTLEKFHRGGDLIIPETVVRLGTWPGGETRFQIPDYISSSGSGGIFEGTTDIQVSIKQEIEHKVLNEKGIDIGIIAGLTLPTGSRVLTSTRVDPFVQGIAFYRYKNHTIGTSHAIFMPTEFPDDLILDRGGNRNISYQPTAILFRHLKVGKNKEEKADVWIEYAGLISENSSSNQIIDMGAVWRPVKRHQVDIRMGFGLTQEAPRAFIGFGYSWLPGKILPFYKRASEHIYRP